MLAEQLNLGYAGFRDGWMTAYWHAMKHEPYLPRGRLLQEGERRIITRSRIERQTYANGWAMGYDGAVTSFTYKQSGTRVGYGSDTDEGGGDE